jgi:hypothetical protein
MTHNLPELLQHQLHDAREALAHSGTIPAWRVPRIELRTVPIWHRQAIYDALGPPSFRPPLDQAGLDPNLRRSIEAYNREHGLPLVYPRKVAWPDRSIGHLRRTLLTLLTLDLDKLLGQAAAIGTPISHSACTSRGTVRCDTANRRAIASEVCGCSCLVLSAVIHNHRQNETGRRGRDRLPSAPVSFCLLWSTITDKTRQAGMR